MAEQPITPREKDFASWYQDVVLQGDMAEPAEIVKGCMVMKPNGYAIWEILQREFDDRFKATGHQNIYLPLLIPQSFLQKEAEKFAGALRSYSMEAMMQNGLALQAGTSHDLGQNFGKAFDVKFQTKEGKLDYVWQTSWGVSTRLVGGLVMTHSDDKGLVLPPKVAPRKSVLVPIYRKDEERSQVLELADKLAKDLGAHVDVRDGFTPGAKFFHWERRGVPVVFELGPRDVQSGNIVLKRRDTGQKETVPQSDAVRTLAATLETMQKDLYNKAKQKLQQSTVIANSIKEVESILNEV